MRGLTVMCVIQIALSTLQRSHQSMPKNLYFPGLPQYNRASGFSPTIIPGQSQTGRRPRNGNKNDRCEYCGKVSQQNRDPNVTVRIRNFATIEFVGTKMIRRRSTSTKTPFVENTFSESEFLTKIFFDEISLRQKYSSTKTISFFGRRKNFSRKGIFDKKFRCQFVALGRFFLTRPISLAIFFLPGYCR